jgi:hypothetical protein
MEVVQEWKQPTTTIKPPTPRTETPLSSTNNSPTMSILYETDTHVIWCFKDHPDLPYSTPRMFYPLTS